MCVKWNCSQNERTTACQQPGGWLECPAIVQVLRIKVRLVPRGQTLDEKVWPRESNLTFIPSGYYIDMYVTRVDLCELLQLTVAVRAVLVDSGFIIQSPTPLKPHELFGQ